MRAGCRFVVETIDSVREYTMRTGRPSFHAAKARNGCTDRSSFDPNASTHRCGNDSHLLRRSPQNLRDVGAIHIRRLRAGLNLDAITHPPREPRLRLDVGVLDKSRFIFAFNDDVGFR